MISAAILPAAHSDLAVIQATLAPVGPTDVVVRLGATGICHSDLLAIEGRLIPPAWPVILGHEAAGTIEVIGPQVTGLAVGDRVIASFVATCGRCFWCTHDQAFLCARYAEAAKAPTPKLTWEGADVYATGILGSFAEAMVTAADAVVRIETDLPDRVLALVGCALSTGVCAVTNAAKVHAGDGVVVFGAGGVGQAVIQAARLVGAYPVIAVDPDQSKRDAAVLAGASVTLDPTVVNSVEMVLDATSGRGADFAFESAGMESTSTQCYQATRRGGTVVLLGAQPAHASPGWSSLDQMATGRRTMGALYGWAQPRRDFPRLVRLIEAGLIDAESLVTHTYELNDINHGIHALTSGNAIRGVVEFG